MAEETQDMLQGKMTRHQRYYLLNRESRNQKNKEAYNNRPDVIAKREERERIKAEKEAQKKAEKEAEKEAKKETKRQQKQLELQEKTRIAAETKRQRKPKSEATSDYPASV